MSNSLDPDQAQHCTSYQQTPLVCKVINLWHYCDKEVITVVLFDLILYVPVNNLSVTSGRVFLV